MRSPALRQHDHLQILLDLVKAFETVPYHLLVKAAVAKGYPLVVLRLSIAAYRLARSLGVDGIYSKLLLATRVSRLAQALRLPSFACSCSTS